MTLLKIWRFLKMIYQLLANGMDLLKDMDARQRLFETETRLELAAHRGLLEKILVASDPLSLPPATGVGVEIQLEDGTILKEIPPMINITNTQKFKFTLRYVNKGKPARVETINAVSSDETVLSINQISADETTGTYVYEVDGVGRGGEAHAVVTADGDLGDGVNPIVTDIPVTVTLSGATATLEPEIGPVEEQ